MDTGWNRLAEAVLTSTHNLCFGSKIRKIVIPLQSPVFLFKDGGLKGYILQGYVFLMVIPIQMPYNVQLSVRDSVKHQFIHFH